MILCDFKSLKLESFEIAEIIRTIQQQKRVKPIKK